METTSDHSELFNGLRQPNRSGLPKYMLLTNALIEGITSGHWKAGDKLPTEEELAEITPFSLGTVQRALRSLAEQGILVRQHGLGSFVTDTKLRLEDPWHCRFLANDGHSFLPIYSKVLKREQAVAPGSWTQHFPNARNSVIKIDRVINVDNEFNVFTQFYADRNLLPGLWEKPLAKLNGLNFKKLIAQESNVPITHVDHLVRLTRLDTDMASVLDVAANSPGIFLQAIARMGVSACVYYQEFFIPPTERVLSVPAEMGSAFSSRTGR
jgi:GntR family transcriptional regulator